MLHKFMNRNLKQIKLVHRINFILNKKLQNEIRPFQKFSKKFLNTSKKVKSVFI